MTSTIFNARLSVDGGGGSGGKKGKDLGVLIFKWIEASERPNSAGE